MDRIGIFGIGNVGRSVASRLSGTDLAKDVFLFGPDDSAIEGFVWDLNDAQFLLGGPEFHRGTEADIASLDYVIVTAGTRPSVDKGGDRNSGMADAFDIVRDIARQLSGAGYRNDVLLATNPLDVMTYAMSLLLKENLVYGTGTLLEAARLGRFLHEREGIENEEIFPMVVGEHGPNAVLLSQETRIGLASFSQRDAKEQEEAKRRVVERGTDIARRRGATTEGIAATIRTILEARTGDIETVLPLSLPLKEKGISISRKFLVSQKGIRPLPEGESFASEEGKEYAEAERTVRKNVETLPELLALEKGE